MDGKFAPNGDEIDLWFDHDDGACMFSALPWDALPGDKPAVWPVVESPECLALAVEAVESFLDHGIDDWLFPERDRELMQSDLWPVRDTLRRWARRIQIITESALADAEIESGEVLG